MTNYQLAHQYLQFPISRDPPEGGTRISAITSSPHHEVCFQFLGIPPKGEQDWEEEDNPWDSEFPISRDPPEGGTFLGKACCKHSYRFPISRDPPEGGTDYEAAIVELDYHRFPISRDPPEGGTREPQRTGTTPTVFPISRDPPEGGTLCWPNSTGLPIR